MSLAAAKHAQDVLIKGLPLDDDGFLLDHRAWNRAIAQDLANHLGIGPLGATHWLIIDFVRDKYFRTGAMPPMRNLCRKLGVDREAVSKAFGGCRQAWQVAGLPHPGEEALSYMG